MPRQLKQPSAQQEQPENQEIALKALEMAGFNIGDYVKIPLSDAKETWKIAIAIEAPFYGRNVPAAVLQNESNGYFITITLYDLCINNPTTKTQWPEYDTTTQVPRIGAHLTDGKIIFLRRVDGKTETKAIFGQITNSPIQTGKVIASTLQPNTHLVEKIIIKRNRYIIHTEDGQTYILDPSESLDTFDTD